MTTPPAASDTPRPERELLSKIARLLEDHRSWDYEFNADLVLAAVRAHDAARGLSLEADLCSDILAELTRARTKFPGKNVTFAALVEEVGELATAIFEESRGRVRKEAVQVAVMAMRVILDGDHVYEPWRASKGLDPLAAHEAETEGGEGAR